MKILVFDTWLPQAHRKLYNSIIEILSRSNSLIVINKNDYYDCVSDNIQYKTIPLLDLDRGGLWYKRLAHILNFLMARLSILWMKYDRVLIPTYHTRHFGWQKKWMGKAPIFLMEHYNVDDISYPLMLNHYLSYANEVHHLVFAPFIGDYINSLGVDKSRVHFIHHPLFTEDLHKNSNKDNTFINVLCPGLSNDESILESIIEYERDHRILERNSIRLELRSNKDFDNVPQSIRFIKGFLTKEEYESLYNDTDLVLVTYPQSYRFRFSSVILNSMTKHKVLIGNNIDIVRYFSNKYPNNCLVFSSIKEFFDIIVQKHSFNEIEREEFINEHSKESIEIEINSIMENISY